jgi:hypothetical protein
MIMGGRRAREAERQAERLCTPHTIHKPRMPALARLVMNSRVFQRLIERRDTREGLPAAETGQIRRPNAVHSSDGILPEQGEEHDPAADMPAPAADLRLTGTEIRDLRRKAIISSLLHSAGRWGER